MNANFINAWVAVALGEVIQRVPNIKENVTTVSEHMNRYLIQIND